MEQLSVYLAGGMRTNWQKKVKEACPLLHFIDPCDHLISSADIKGPEIVDQYAAWDIHAVKRSEIVFAYFERTNPSGIGMTTETGIAFGKGKTVILVLEDNNEHQPDRYIQFLRKAATIVFSDFNEAVKYLKTFEKMLPKHEVRIVEEEHHGALVKVSKFIENYRKSDCLCYNCKKFKPLKPEENCYKAQRLYNFAIENEMAFAITRCETNEPDENYFEKKKEV